MDYDVKLSAEAERDIEELYAYIAAHDCAENAEKLLASIDDAIDRLAELPFRGNVPKELQAAGEKEFRELHYKPYRIIYHAGEGEVVILCVVDGRRDMRSFLQRRLLR